MNNKANLFVDEENFSKNENRDRNAPFPNNSKQLEPARSDAINEISSTFNPKPASIMSLEDRDVIVIDKVDIQESTKNESDVIVVDKYGQQEIDLADLLGNNWPNTAGDAAKILNSCTTKSQSEGIGSSAAGCINNGIQTRKERNKSSNPLAHFGTMRHSDKSGQQEMRRAPVSSSHTRAANTNLSANDSSEASPRNTISALPLTLNDVEFPQKSTLQDIPGNKGLGLGSMVEINLPEISEDLYGVVRWIGLPPGAKDVMVGIELEDNPKDKKILTTDGSFNCIPLFKCNEGRALFVTPGNCEKDRRFVDVDTAQTPKVEENNNSSMQMFGNVDCPSVPGAVTPIKVRNLEDLEGICGKFKGIQGHHNSCYLDATLFAMFTFTSVFDSLLFRPPEPEDIPHYSEVQKVLREDIVNPLRKNIFVRADRVMKLRQLLDKLSSVSGLTSEEKDPEEFLNSLLAQIMRVEPFLKLSSGQDAFFYQLFVEKDERLSFPSVQQLFEQSFYSSDIKLKEVPSCLIIQMPRFGKSYKMYPRILPSQVLDVTDVIEDSPRQCSVCGKLAEHECRACFGILQGNMGLESTGFCSNCLETVHLHAKRNNHTYKKLSVPQDFRIMAEHMTVPRLYMELFAVVCIETSHYVAFVKSGSGPDAPWCFFDSMADRKGEKNGYNIPEMITVPDLPQWLSDEGARAVHETSMSDKMLPEHAKRLFCDAYLCMYQSSDVMMYR